MNCPKSNKAKELGCSGVTQSQNLQRIRCSYCGLFNVPTEISCVGCGAVIEPPHIQIKKRRLSLSINKIKMKRRKSESPSMQKVDETRNDEEQQHISTYLDNKNYDYDKFLYKIVNYDKPYVSKTKNSITKNSYQNGKYISSKRKNKNNFVEYSDILSNYISEGNVLKDNIDQYSIINKIIY